MVEPLTPEQVQKLLEHLDRLATKDACRTCDCFQAVVVQLEMDAAEEAGRLMESLRPNRSDMHSCLGCSPCGPGQLYAQYVRGEV